MCGILGLVAGKGCACPTSTLINITSKLFKLSESRGSEAAGIAILNRNSIDVLKSSVSASEMLHTTKYKNFIKQSVNFNFINDGGALIGHSRLVTNGRREVPGNNQPVILESSVGVHNGIVVNCEDIWEKNKYIKRTYEVDSEVIFRLIDYFRQDNNSLIKSVQYAFNEISGTASIASLYADLDVILLATNNGSIYAYRDNKRKIFFFASEKHFIERIIKYYFSDPELNFDEIFQVKASNGYLISPKSLELCGFDIGINANADFNVDTSKKKSIVIVDEVGNLSDKDNQDHVLSTIDFVKKSTITSYTHDAFWQDSLRRCTKCILPETMPFIEFDEHGVCNYCLNYKKINHLGERSLIDRIQPYKKRNNDVDCIVGVSGGRDSIYTLHYMKNILGMNPVAYTYDWGMVTDLARRNISRICGKLGIEHIVISANIENKRKYIYKNVLAWLEKPDLGMVPLFMSGDKEYFFHLERIRSRLGLNLAIMGENLLERTDFKTGFAGIRPFSDSGHVYTLPLFSKLQLTFFYFKQFVLNPGYFNSSLLDTFFAATCYYAMKKNYVNLFNYIPWIEEDVIATLKTDYDFELASDSKSTWRIGDGTSAFYNYIYYNIAGFTENDTFRSNQIREGLLTRSKAIELVKDENIPRIDTIVWYLNVIGLGNEVASILNKIRLSDKLIRKSCFEEN